MEILVTYNLKDKYLEQIASVGTGLKVVRETEPERIRQRAADAEVMLVWSPDFRPEMVDLAGNLKWIQSLTAGVERILCPAIKERGIILTSSAGIHAIPISEHVFAFILSDARRLPRYFELKKERKWDRLRVDEASGKTIGIIGFGHIGREIARKARAFGMTVLAVRRHPRPDPDADEVHGPESIGNVLGRSDFVVLALPSTPDNRGFLDRDKIAMMKEDALLINIARGDIVDEKALVDALRQGAIRGAALDVFEEEPLPAGSPLWDLDQVMLTHHVAGGSPHYNRRAVDLFCRNLARYLKGEKLLNVVDPDLGY